MENKNMKQFYSYNGEKYNDIAPALRAFLNDDKKKPHCIGVMYHDKYEYTGHQITGVSDDGKPWFTNLYDNSDLPIHQGKDIFNKILAQKESGFEPFYSYEGVEYKNIQDALIHFLEDENKKPHSAGITYHDKYKDSGYQVTGVGEDGEPYYTTLFNNNPALPIKEGFSDFQILLENYKKGKDNSFTIEEDRQLTQFKEALSNFNINNINLDDFSNNQDKKNHQKNHNIT